MIDADQGIAGGSTLGCCFSREAKFEGNPARQLLIPDSRVSAVVDRDGCLFAQLDSGREVRIVARAEDAAEEQFALHADRWDSASEPSGLDSAQWAGRRERDLPSRVLTSLEGRFTYAQEDRPSGRPGLRVPQIGAVHAVLGYWTTDPREPSTVVMPTGTGKTEAMLALLAAARPERLLVLVPSDALRTQIADKFETYGVLPACGALSGPLLYPVVGRVQSQFSSPDVAREFTNACNVIVTTPDALPADAAVRQALLARCSHLFVDEAHHVPARTWSDVRADFAGKPVVQFTATPFREDGKHLGGRLVYAFPLREAQQQGYFSRIDYISVPQLHQPDRRIAETAVERLRRDLADGRDHVLMARAARIGRAQEILPLYQELAPDLNPVLIHSKGSVRQRRAALEALRQRGTRVVVCVNMLGEGFDLPNLKIAAIHDPFKSLGVTLQFIGRFARTQGGDIGDAAVVVGRPEGNYDARLRALFSEDADWNSIVRDISETAVGEQERLSEFEQGFGTLPDEVSMRSLLPKMSTVVYEMAQADWTPAAIYEVFPEEQLLTVPVAINARDRVAWFVSETRTPVRWGDYRSVEEVAYHLYAVYCDAARRLLYINSSDNSSIHESLAAAVGGGDVRRYTGETVYRVMSGMKRLVPTNLGLLDTRNRLRRFSMHVGADVVEGFSTAEARTKAKTNIFAYGYEAGQRVSMGASLKGRIWSYRVANSLKDWTDWCDTVGTKLTDATVNIDDVMRDFIRPEAITSRPPLVPLALEWPWSVLANMSDELRVEFQGTHWPAVDIDLVVGAHETQGPIPFHLVSPDWILDYELDFTPDGMTYRPVGPDGSVIAGRQVLSLSEYLSRDGLYVLFEQDATAVPPGTLIRPDRELPPFDPDKLEDIDWAGISLNVESQGPDRDPTSIQARAIEWVSALDEWDLILDDDGTGEVADIVAIKKNGRDLQVLLVHCKYASQGEPRARLDDLYEVCGQAQRSVRWRQAVPSMFEMLRRREKQRLERGAPSGFMTGDEQVFFRLMDDSLTLRPVFTIAIVQPGVTKARVSAGQLELLASTETYVLETANAPLRVICSQ